MTKPGIYNKRVKGMMRRVQINAKGQWKFLKGKPRAAPKQKRSKPKKQKPHKSKSSSCSHRRRRRGILGY